MKILKRLAARSANPQGCRPVLIVCLGDSVTHGCFELRMPSPDRVGSAHRPWEGYPARLQRELSMRYPIAAPTVLNAGVGGNAARQMAERLHRDALSFRPDLVILELGLNDCLERGGDAVRFARMTGDMLGRIVEAGAEAMLLTPNAMCGRVDPAICQSAFLRDLFERAAEAQNSGRMTAFVEAARREAVMRGVPVADAYARWQEMRARGADTAALLANGINHPRPELHDLFVREILQAMER